MIIKSRFFVVLALLLCMFFCGACKEGVSVNKNESVSDSIMIVDSIGRKVKVKHPVTRAVVSNAYNAELITAIGAFDSIIGVDYYIFQDQEGFRNKFTTEQVIGKSQNELNYEKIIELNPQVLILTGNGIWEDAAKKLEDFGIAVVVCDAYYTDQFSNSVKLLGNIFGKEKEAEELENYFLSKLSYIDKQLKNIPHQSVYFEYRQAGNTTIPGNYFYEMVSKAHGDNIFKDAKSPNVDIEAVVTRNPANIIKVSDSKVYSSYIPPSREDMNRIFSEITERPGWERIEAVKNKKILLLSHYAHGGASKLVGCMYIAKFLYPEFLPDLHPEEVFKTWVTKYQGLEYKAGHTYPIFKLTD